MNSDLDLNSSVELIFKTDYLPLDRMAGKGQVDRTKDNTLNPDAEDRKNDSWLIQQGYEYAEWKRQCSTL